jgi:hypothetical protein
LAHLKDDVIYCKRDWQILSPGEALKSTWDRFCEKLKHSTRFLFFDHEDERDDEPYHVPLTELLNQLGDVIRDCGLIHDVGTGTRIFRVRAHKPGKGYTTPIDLGPPPPEFATTAGRMNAPGIVVMYAAYSRNTALAEVTGEDTELSVAEFEFKESVRVVDLTNIPPAPSIFDEGPREALQFLRHFADDVSQPFTPDAKAHVEYTPTQVVAEYLRHRLRDGDGSIIRGVIYRSSKDDEGINIALFVNSEEIEGVAPKYPWRTKAPLLRLVKVSLCRFRH